MKTKWTPQTVKCVDRDLFIREVIDERGDCIAELSVESTQDKLASRNEALICAAPDMLEALEDLYTAIKDCPEMCDAMKTIGFDIDVMESMQLAKRIIRKARGEV